MLRRHAASAAVLAVLATIAMSGCTAVRPGRGGVETGHASWYGPGFHGKRTANGEVYDMDALTAAHKKLPFGTEVRVTNLDNGRTVEVRINDRGPFVRGRIIDLSKAAAATIGMLGPGTARVRLDILFQPVEAGFIIQAGAFSDSANAMDLLNELKPEFPDAAIYSDGRWHRIQIGPFGSRSDAKRIARRLEARGIGTLVRSSG